MMFTGPLSAEFLDRIIIEVFSTIGHECFCSCECVEYARETVNRGFCCARCFIFRDPYMLGKRVKEQA